MVSTERISHGPGTFALLETVAARHASCKAPPDLQVPDDMKTVLTPARPEGAAESIDRVWTRLKT